MPRKETIQPPATAQAQQDAVADGIDNYELPKSLVTRIAKSSIPDNSKLQKDTVTALLKGSTVFINYLAATAHDIATSRQHKSVSASDVLKALETVQLENMVAIVQDELNHYRELAKNTKKPGRTGDHSSKGKSKGKERAAVDDQLSEQHTTDGHRSAHVPDIDVDGDQEMHDVDRSGLGEDELGNDEDDGAGLEDELDEEDELADDIDEVDETEPLPVEDSMVVEQEMLKKGQSRVNLGQKDDDSDG